MTERELLARIGEADDGALERLYALYYPRLGRFLWRLNLRREQTEEVINDTFLVIWQKAAAFRGASSPSTWIMGIAYKKALKCMKRERNFAPLEAQAIATDDTNSRRHEISAALRELPEKHRAVVVLAFDFGYSYREIAQILNCPENTVKTRMFNAKKTLKVLLDA